MAQKNFRLPSGYMVQFINCQETEEDHIVFELLPIGKLI